MDEGQKRRARVKVGDRQRTGPEREDAEQRAFESVEASGPPGDEEGESD